MNRLRPFRRVAWNALRWLFRPAVYFFHSHYFLPFALFVIYGLIAAAGGYFLLERTDLGTETTTVREAPAPAVGQAAATTGDEPPVKSKTTKTSVAVLAVYTAFAAGGWLLIPLKFSWDELAKKTDGQRAELAKRADADRHESQQVADDVRETRSKMRDIIYKVLEVDHGPLILNQSDVRGWARRCLRARQIGSPPPLPRLLYAVARLCDAHEHLRHDGVLTMLATEEAETAVVGANSALERHVWSMLGSPAAGEDLVLRQAILSNATNNGADRFIPFETFERRLQAGQIAGIYRFFEARCAEPRYLNELAEHADRAYDYICYAYTDVYSDWYPKPPPGSPPAKAPWVNPDSLALPNDPGFS